MSGSCLCSNDYLELYNEADCVPKITIRSARFYISKHQDPTIEVELKNPLPRDVQLLIQRSMVVTLVAISSSEYSYYVEFSSATKFQLYFKMSFSFRQLKMQMRLNKTAAGSRLLGTSEYNYDIQFSEDDLQMNIGPFLAVSSDSKNDKASRNLQTASKNLAENPDDMSLVKLIGVLAAVEVFSYVLPCIQWSILLLLLNTPLPPNFYNMMRFIASFMYSSIPDWEVSINKGRAKFYSQTVSDGSASSWSHRIRRLNISSSSLANLEYIYLILSLAIALKLVLLLVSHHQQQESATRRKVIQNVHRFIWFYVEANFALILVSLLVDLSSYDFSLGFIKYVSFMLSIVLLAALLVFFVYIFHLFGKSQPEKEVRDRYCYYFEDITAVRKDNIYFHHFTYAKKIITIFILVFIQDSFAVQVWTLVILYVIYLIYTLRLRPHKHLFVSYLVALAEVMMLVLLIFIFSADKYIGDMLSKQIITPDDQSTVLNFGWALFPFFFIHQIIYGAIGIYNGVQYIRSQFNASSAEEIAPIKFTNELSPRSQAINQQKKITPDLVYNAADFDKVKQFIIDQISHNFKNAEAKQPDGSQIPPSATRNQQLVPKLELSPELLRDSELQQQTSTQKTQLLAQSKIPPQSVFRSQIPEEDRSAQPLPLSKAGDTPQTYLER